MRLEFDDVPSEERLLAALERIAMALEMSAGLERPNEEAQDTSGVFYVDDRAELEREVRKELYRERTGQALSEEEDVPRPVDTPWARLTE